MKIKDQVVSIPLRVPSEVKEWLEKKSEFSRRSISAEVLFQLEENFRADQSKATKGAESAGRKAG